MAPPCSSWDTGKVVYVEYLLKCYIQMDITSLLLNKSIRRAVETKALLRVQFLLTFFGGLKGGKSKKLWLYLVKRKESIESQQKFDFFS